MEAEGVCGVLYDHQDPWWKNRISLPLVRFLGSRLGSELKICTWEVDWRGKVWGRHAGRGRKQDWGASHSLSRGFSHTPAPPQRALELGQLSGLLQIEATDWTFAPHRSQSSDTGSPWRRGVTWSYAQS